ncbi:PHP domain-containing protein [Catenuloplanes atrovinosus]|uniref:Polymerase/histidinol phosphatase N-terminal domain-containing protein n=1 Tax=Catenuloplanes atrovinosus TaxID=137266 RepID=A0AAE3YST1_9ACTN|nr:PHP domain-containing protein [Catenuloplanes atrovinosus]MDR7278587.1 hypothetical protein [Catenuloplanes atrovinosus]
MGHGHPHTHDHDHGHSHDHDGAPTPEALDLSIPDSELSPADVSRRGFLRSAGLLGAAAGLTGAGTAAGVLGTPEIAVAHSGSTKQGDFTWRAGDHHIHTQYSSDAKYRVADHVQHGVAYGLDWLVITDHGGATHAKIGVEKVNPDIVAARELFPEALVFQGLEWNIPAAEHGTIIVHPGKKEVEVLKEFENNFDGSVKGASSQSAANEALAIAGLNFLAAAKKARRVNDAMFFANHPSRKGLDSPHEIRGWRDAQPEIALGFEGAPGHQAAAIPTANFGPGGGRGFYDSSPGADSFPGYPLESYRTWGGFDWMTSTVGGLWDSLLAEGKPWWITANSDSHNVLWDTSVRGANSDFNANGRYNDPQHGFKPDVTAGDFWPGFYSRTHVGAAGGDYRHLMDGLRAGRVWVDHGGLIKSLDVRARVQGDRNRKGGTPLGGVLKVRKGTPVEVTIDVELADKPNWAQLLPVLARVDLIMGAVTGAAANRDVFTAPQTKVVKSFEVAKGKKTVSFTYSFGRVSSPFYFRVRGTDGNFTQTGIYGAAVDPVGPKLDVVGDADPWLDLWFYANPIWVLPY